MFDYYVSNKRLSVMLLFLQLSVSWFLLDLVDYTLASSKEDLSVSIGPDKEVWTYHCVNDKCQRLMTKEYVEGSNGSHELVEREATSYNACKLLCGSSTGTLWPLPTGIVEIAGPAVPVHPKNTEIVIKSDSTEDMEPKSKELFDQLSKHFEDKISKKFPENVPVKRSISNRLIITGVVKKPNHISLDLTTDESYTIELEHDRTNEIKALVSSDNFFGLRHGLETLSQLIVYDDYEKVLIMPWKIRINDTPAFPYRGLTLDTSRNFIKVNSIKRTVDAMAANKLNIFHWHISDTHSFPLQLPSLPQLAKFGAYGPDKVYHPNEVKELVEYARLRGVKIVPEFDAPAHVGYGWQWTPKPVVVCLNEQPWLDYCVEAPCGQFDPTEELLYDLLSMLYEDMFNLFSVDSLFHMGGDEVHFRCWNKTSKIQNWMIDRGWKTDDEGFLQLWNYFQQRALEIVMTKSAKAGKKTSPDILLWTSHLTTGEALNKYVDQSKYIIQIWTQGWDANVGELISKGYRVVFSNYDALYLDCGFGSWVSSGNNWCSPYIPWQKLYMNDPVKIVQNLTGGNYTEEMRKQILGQVATLWTEQVDDVSMDSRFWPRALALAERTWTNPETDWRSAEYRFLYQRERLVQLGIAADGQEPLFCSYYEGSCPTDNH